MENIYNVILLALALWIGNYSIYLCINHGLAPNAKLQQFLRYLPAAVVAVLPIAITGSEVFQIATIKLLAIAELWALAYPLTYHLTYRKSSPDYDNQIDPAFGIYLFGIMSGLAILLPSPIMAILSAIAIIPPVFVIGYYLIYKQVLDINGMLPILQTNYNEAVEFLRAYSLWRIIVCVVTTLALIVAFLFVGNDFISNELNVWMIAIIVVMELGVGHYMFKPNHGIFGRIGIVKLYYEVKEYTHKNNLYIKNQEERMHNLRSECIHPLSKPHTLFLIVGESASRDFMSAFTDMEEDTTPWLRQLAEDKQHCVLFPNAYSCDIQTVPVLEKALTSYNQYDGGEFFTSTSIVNIARSLGYKVHWYSNQGNLGSAETPITLVAENADVAKWTNQQFGKKYYDGTLTDFIEELDCSCNNLIIFHLMGSHFNYENRFPEEYRKWIGDGGIHDKITNYKNTLYYTDCILHQAFEKLQQEYNLQGMIYFSDHGDVPDRHRQPKFGGFKDTRIPLAVWMGDDYLNNRPKRVKALQSNSNEYWTNDLLYDLLCGFMDAECSEFKEANSLASEEYKYQKDDLTIMNGRVHISDDKTMENGID